MRLSGEAPDTRAPFDPRRYHESVTGERTEIAERPPVCLYLEVTNRCNLLCTTCPRTYEELEPPADMAWDLFVKIVDQVPDLTRAVLHGVGEPMLVKNLPTMVRYLKDREGHAKPKVSAWLTGLRDTIAELPAFVRVAAEIGVKEVYLQRLVFFEEEAVGHARPDQALYERMNREEAAYLEEATTFAQSRGMIFS